jgi:DNA-binding NarL/FixJ family response regulator
MKSFITLLVEDNISFRQTLFDILSAQFPSMVIQEAGNGKEAFQKIESVVPNLIFMDIKLPGENGLELTKKIKAAHPGVIIIVLTSYDLPEYREAAYQYGANYFIIKGSSTNEEILALVGSIAKDSGFKSNGSKGKNPS